MGNSKSSEAKSGSSSSKADELSQKAAEAHAAGKIPEALQLYNEASECCWVALKNEAHNKKTKEAIKNKHIDILECIEKIEKKTQAKQKTGTAAPRRTGTEAPRKTGTAAKAKSTSSNNERVDMPQSEPAGIEAADNPQVHWEDIAGQTAAKESLKEAVVLPARFPHLFTGSRQQCKGVLLYGPAGSGKSQLCKAAATESGSTFFPISSSHILSSYKGHSERLIKMLFATARAKKPAVIFITKLEGLFMTSSRSLYEHLTRIKREFIYQMREDNKGVVVLATTNIPWELDQDIVKCFEKKLFIDLPDLEARTEILKINLMHTKNCVDHQQFVTLGRDTEGYSGADIEVIARDALMMPLRKVQSATHFKKATEFDPNDPTKLVNDLYTPCSPADVGAIKMNWVDVPSNKLLEPSVTYIDCIRSVQNTRPTVTADELKGFKMFALAI